MKYALRFIILSLLSMSVWASPNARDWYHLDAQKEPVIHVTLFLSSTCPHCHHADAFFNEFKAHNQGIEVSRYFINDDKNALIKFNEFLQAQGLNDFAVPSVFFCNSRWMGFDSAKTTGKELVDAMQYCRHEIQKKGRLTQETIQFLRQKANASQFNSALIDKPSAMKYILAMALMDVFNPCALFALGTFLALLFLSKTQRLQLIVGFLFIAVLGGAHIIQQIHTPFFYHMLVWLRYPAALVGLFVFYSVGRYRRQKPIDMWLPILSIALAFTVCSYQEMCVMNWSNVFEDWLHTKGISSTPYVLYQFAFQFFYLMPSILILLGYVMLTRRFKGLDLRLRPMGLFFLLVLALFLMVYPTGLSNLALSVMVLLTSVILGLVFRRFWPMN